jgi:hypothetical protein
MSVSKISLRYLDPPLERVMGQTSGAETVQLLDCKSSLPSWELGLAVQVLDGARRGRLTAFFDRLALVADDEIGWLGYHVVWDRIKIGLEQRMDTNSDRVTQCPGIRPILVCIYPRSARLCQMASHVVPALSRPAVCRLVVLNLLLGKGAPALVQLRRIEIALV